MTMFRNSRAALLAMGLLSLSAVCASLAGATAPFSVLFVGNSFTYVNDMPHTFVAICRSRGDQAVVDMAAPGG